MGRQLTLYWPSAGLSNYRFEFIGRIEKKSLGWVFRVADTRNYYVAKLEISSPGTRLTMSRFAVIKGKEYRRTRFTLPMVYGGGAIKVKLDAKGSQFTIYVQDKLVDSWRDNRLQTGGVGFLSEREERGQIESFRFSFPNSGS